MTFTTSEFCFFFVAVLAMHWALPRRAGMQNAFLLLASWLFYASWDVRLLGLLLLSTAIDYVLAGRIERLRGSAAARRMVALSVAWNVGLLVYCKYLGFFADALNVLLGAAGLSSLTVPAIILPLGLSFYTLQKIGYVTDVSTGRIGACRDPVAFALFTSFFPQIIAGPIARASALLPQLAVPRRLLPERVARGGVLLLIGVLLKAWVADVLGPVFVDPVYADPSQFARLANVMAVVLYPVQVFADFGGYSLIAMGIAALLGIELDVNFNAPFLSTSLPEMWRRWHISLNRWLFDYIYHPLVASGGWFRGRLDVALALVFVTSGLWHGARLTFVIWGALHGAGMILHRRWDEYYRGLCRADRAWVARRKSAAYAAGAWALTQGFFWLSLIPFRATSIGNLAAVLRSIVAPAGTSMPKLGPFPLLSMVLAVAAVVLVHVAATERGGRWRDAFLALPAPVRGLAYGLLVAFLTMTVPVGASTFIYRNF